ncbi:MAG: hypothetical protein ABJA66_04565 [Actinomycetota bacterium]
MCHFITTILPKEAQTEKLKPIFKKHGFDFRVIDDFHLADQLEKGDFCVQTTRGMCDCGTIIGSLACASYSVSTADETLNKSITRFRKKGWSEEHIQNWIAKSNEEYFLRSIKRKFKNKNVSETKIQKWKEQSTENVQKYEMTEAEREERIKSTEPHTKQWFDFLTNVTGSDFTSRIGLLLHDYSGKHANKIKLQGKKTIKLKDLTPLILLEVEEDFIYEFVL